MITTAVIVLVLFFAMRWLVLHISKMPALSNYVGLGIAAAFVGGVLLGTHLPHFGQQPSASDTTPQPTAVAAGTAAPAPRLIVLSPSQLSTLVESTTGAMGNLDAIDGLGTTVPHVFAAGKPLTVSGWVADPVTREPASSIFLIVDDRARIDATRDYGKARPDVANAFSAPALTDTGFEGATIPTVKLARGNHTLRLAAVASDGKNYYEVTTPWTFRLR